MSLAVAMFRLLIRTIVKVSVIGSTVGPASHCPVDAAWACAAPGSCGRPVTHRYG